MENNFLPTSPKPFIFVLMPFSPSFNDIYKFGIKGAAQDAGAYAERIDEQIFIEGMLDRIFNQISKADVVVADMTGRNPNVFYEVGYAHALNKIVILLTQDVNDIPFDLKHRQHVVYGGSIDKLKSELAEKLQWAIAENIKRQDLLSLDPDFIRVTIDGMSLIPSPVGVSGPILRKRHQFPRHTKENSNLIAFEIAIRNTANRNLPPLEFAYLFCRENPYIVPVELVPDGTFQVIQAETTTAYDTHDSLTTCFKLNWKVPLLSQRAIHSIRLNFKALDIEARPDFKDDFPVRLRLVFSEFNYDFPFIIDYERVSPY